MSCLQILAFRIGQASPELIPEAYGKFYLEIAKKLVEEDFDLPGELPQTVPLSNATIQKDPSKIYSIVFNYLCRLPSNSSTVLLDLNTPARRIARGTLLFHLSVALRTWHDQRPNIAKSVRIILLLPELPPEADDVRIQIQPLLTKERIIIVSETGQTLPPVVNFDPNWFLLCQISVRGELLELFQMKLIKRHGHFKRSKGTADYCVPYFYDARFCEPELTEIFKSRIVSSRRGLIPTIAYHGPNSPWLRNAAVAAAEQHNLKSYDLEEDESFCALVASNPTAVLIFTDMIDTGETAQSVFGRLILGIPKAEVLAVSVMASDLDDTQRRLRLIKVETSQIRVECLHEVSQSRVPRGECEMCRLKLPFNTSDEALDTHETLGITTYHMWTTAQAVGLQPEENVPQYRPSFPRVPQFPRLIRENGAWIVSKFRQRLEERVAGFPNDAVIVCPEEKAAIGLAEHIKLLLGFSVINIPRKFIDLFLPDSMAGDLEEIRSTRWYHELRSVAHADILLLDVFNVSGRTLQSLYQLVSKVSLRPPSGCLLYVDLNPSETAKLACETLCLYSLQSNPALQKEHASSEITERVT